MELATPRRRRVFILGHDAALDVEALVRRAIGEGSELLLLILGSRPTSAQDAIVREALGLAERCRLWLDTALVAAPASAADLVRQGEEVTIVASGRERARIRRALGEKLRPAVSGAPVRSPTRRVSHPTAQGDVHRAREARPRDAAGAAEALEPTPRPAADVDHEPLGHAAVASESVEALAGREIPKPVLATVWTSERATAAKRAPLRVYLGAAPGVGKTFAMLAEGQRRKARGTDVVVGIVHTYDRPRTMQMLEGLEVIPTHQIVYREVPFEEMDTEALIERQPDVALIDELAHTNVPGSRRAKRWEDAIDVLEQGIEVVTTLNVQHVASLNDLVAKITEIRQQETVPDWVLDLADQVELVDMSPHSLQRRMLHGNVYPDPRKAELALRRYFTTENLSALRELALMRLANQVNEDLLAHWSGSAAPETRERILVCVSRPEVSDALIRRGARIAQRARGDLLVVHVATGEGPADAAWTETVDHLVEDLGGEFQIVQADDPVEGVLSFAYQQHVTQILVAESLRSRWSELLRGSFVDRLIRRASNIDVHVIARRER